MSVLEYCIREARLCWPIIHTLFGFKQVCGFYFLIKNICIHLYSHSVKQYPVMAALIHANKHLRKPKGQSRMDNPETLGVHKTQDEEKQNTKLKRWATQIPPKSEGELRCSQMESSSCFLQDTLCYSYIQSSLVKVLAVIFRGKKNLLFLF